MTARVVSAMVYASPRPARCGRRGEEQMIYPHVKYLGPAHPDSSDPTTTRELQTRVNDGIQVSLLWRQSDGRVWVAVSDPKTDQAFSLPVRDDERPLDVFH